jgi:tetratricopeptide (TPR) repeat protein
MVTCKVLLEALQKKVQIGNKSAFRPEASASSMMAFYLYSRNDDPSVLLLDSNWYMSQDKSNPLQRPFVDLEQSQYEAGVESMKSGDFPAAIRVFSRLVEKNPLQVAAHYQLARALAQSGKAPEAIVALKRAVAGGWQFRKFTAADTMLAALAGEPAFRELLAKIPDVAFGVMPTRGFSSQWFWGPNGWPNTVPGQGKRLLLTTMLGVAGGDRGCTRQQIIDQLSRSVAADATFPRGSFYFARNDDIRTKTRQDQFDLAVAELGQLGLRGLIGRDIVPQNRKILGATLGTPNPDWLKSGSLFVAGALCDNLTSLGGRMQDKSTQTPLTHFLKLGAAGASGTVTEPLAIASKFPNARIHVHYARGCNLAEAFYQSVSGPYQLLIVGDPLCQPWARRPKFEVRGVSDGEPIGKGLELELLPANQGPGISRYELFLDGRKFAVVPGNRTSINIANDGLSGGYHEIRIVAVDDTLIGTRSGKRFSVTNPLAGRQVGLDLEGKGPFQLARSVLLAVHSNFGDRIEIRQNSRVVAVVDGQSGEVRIDCSLLGSGRSELQAVVRDGDMDVFSPPVSVEIESG